MTVIAALVNNTSCCIKGIYKQGKPEVLLYKVFIKIWGYAAAFVFIATIIVSITICRKTDRLYPESDEAKKKKQYSRELAENLRYFDFEFIDRELFTFKNCRIKKLRRGAFTFGAFNVLELDDLVINIPVIKDGMTEGKDSEAAKGDTNSLLRVFSSFKTIGKKRFSCIEINHLTINKYLDANQYVQIEAQRAESNFEKTIQLKQCVVTTNGIQKISIGKAFIEFKPSAALRYTLEGCTKKIAL